MKKSAILTGICIMFLSLTNHAQDAPRLIIRGDDIASTHGANIGCIKSYKDGIMRSVEIMVPCPWFPEAVKMLEEVPGLDVGVHITLTSEWENIKWGPLTHAPSLTDEDGYFFPQIWPSDRFPEERTIKGANWKLDINTNDHKVKYFPARITGESSEERVAAFIDGLKKLEPGSNYLFVEHPAIAGNEMEAVGHDGYYTVNADRQMVTEMFTSPAIKQAIEELGIELISYADLVK